MILAGSDDDDLRINTLHRFAKRSPRLILHEYSHCEVHVRAARLPAPPTFPDDEQIGELRDFDLYSAFKIRELVTAAGVR